MRSQPLSDLVPPFVTGRPRELFLPLLVIAELAGGSPWREDLFHVFRRTLNERESLPDEGRALFYVLQVRLANRDSLMLCPGDLVDEISRELDMQMDRGERISSKKVGNLLNRYGFERAPKTNRCNPYRITRADFMEKAQRNGYPFSGDFAEIKPKPPTGSGFPELENLDA
jgi:hypothetical protein